MENNRLQFEPITEDEKLWAVFYEDDDRNILQKTFEKWSNLDYLEEFFDRHLTDLSSYFHITDVDEAIYDTIQDARTLECLILDLKPETNLDELFRPLENLRTPERVLSKEKAKGKASLRHPSWLRLYAIRFEQGRYLITGGAIKLTRTMEERDHTLRELVKMEQVRSYLIENGAIDFEGFMEMIQ